MIEKIVKNPISRTHNHITKFKAYRVFISMLRLVLATIAFPSFQNISQLSRFFIFPLSFQHFNMLLSRQHSKLKRNVEGMRLLFRPCLQKGVTNYLFLLFGTLFVLDSTILLSVVNKSTITKIVYKNLGLI